MSDCGIIIKNNINRIQIDSTYKNFSKLDSGSKTIHSCGDNEYIDFLNTDNTPLIAIRPGTQMHCCIATIEKDNNNIFYRAMLYREYFYYSDCMCKDITDTINWIVFNVGIKNNLPTYGFVVRNSNNEVVFSSNEKFLKIKGIYTFTNNFNDISVQDADNNYFLLYPFSWMLTVVTEYHAGCMDFQKEHYSMGLIKNSSTSIGVNKFLIERRGTTNSFSVPDAWSSSHTLIEIGE
jgi:hypothetical protein